MSSFAPSHHFGRFQPREIFVMSFILLLAILLHSPVDAISEDLCFNTACNCTQNQANSHLVDISCQFSHKKEVLKLGGPFNSHGANWLPSNAGQLRLEGCHHVELFTGSLNHVPEMNSVSITNSHKVKIHHRIVESRKNIKNRDKETMSLNDFSISSVKQLDVKRQSFEGITVDGTFTLLHVAMKMVPSLAFNLDYVNKFNIIRSTFDRVSMWGFKLTNSSEFSILRNSRFFSLASQALHIECDKFVLTGSTFDSLQDASFSIRYKQSADIQGNTFESLNGKPFSALQPFAQELKNVDENNSFQLKFTFWENKFKADPTLPFNALAMQSFKQSNHFDVDLNHFVCDCDKLAWFLGAVEYYFDTAAISGNTSTGSLAFLFKIYDTSGQCLKCDLHHCKTTDKSFKQFAKNALHWHDGHLKCSSSGMPLKSHSPEIEFNYGDGWQNGNDGEGGGSLVADRNLELSDSGSRQHVTVLSSLITVLIPAFTAAILK